MRRQQYLLTRPTTIVNFGDKTVMYNFKIEGFVESLYCHPCNIITESHGKILILWILRNMSCNSSYNIISIENNRWIAGKFFSTCIKRRKSLWTLCKFHLNSFRGYHLLRQKQSTIAQQQIPGPDKTTQMFPVFCLVCILSSSTKRIGGVKPWVFWIYLFVNSVM